MNQKPGAEERVRAALQSALHPAELEVVNDSDRHADHYVDPVGADQQGESHFTVRIVAEAFAGKTRVQRHRMVNEALAAELAGTVHALAIHAKAPGE